MTVYAESCESFQLLPNPEWSWGNPTQDKSKLCAPQQDKMKRTQYHFCKIHVPNTQSEPNFRKHEMNPKRASYVITNL